MRENGLSCRKRRVSRTHTTDSKHKLRKYPNLLRNSIAEGRSTIVGDVTAFDIKGKTHYCAHLLDLSNREPIGIAVSDRIDTELVSAALQMAEKKRGSLAGYVHHTDSDSRYCSDYYINQLKSKKVIISMCLGDAYENAHSESFNRTLKRQEINIQDYQSKEQATESILKFIKLYTVLRPHSPLGMLTPAEYRKKYLSNK